MNEVWIFVPKMYRKLVHRLNSCGYRPLFKRTLFAKSRVYTLYATKSVE